MKKKKGTYWTGSRTGPYKILDKRGEVVHITYASSKMNTLFNGFGRAIHISCLVDDIPCSADEFLLSTIK